MRDLRRHRIGYIESSFYWDDSVGKVPNTAALLRELESGGRFVDVDDLCEEYHDPSTGFLVIGYVHGGKRYRVHVRGRVEPNRLLQEASVQPDLTPTIFVDFSKVELDAGGRDLTDLFTASAGPFRDFGGSAVAPDEPSATASIPIEDILTGGDIDFQQGAQLLVRGPGGSERVPVSAVIQVTRSGTGSQNPKLHET